MDWEKRWEESFDRGWREIEAGRRAEAMPHLREALAAAEQLGPRDGRLSRTLVQLASFEDSQGEEEESQALYRRVLALREADPGAGRHADVHDAMRRLRDLATKRGDLAAALDQARAAVGFHPTDGGPLGYWGDHHALASLLLKAGRTSEAEAEYRRGLESAEQVCFAQLGQDGYPYAMKDGQPSAHPGLAQPLENAAGFFEAQGRLAEAVPLLERLAASWGLARCDVECGRTFRRLGELLRRLGQHAEADQRHRSAIRLFESAGDLREAIESARTLYRSPLLAGAPEQEDLRRRALQLAERVDGPAGPNTLASMVDLADHYAGSPATAGEAERLLSRVLADIGTRVDHAAKALCHIGLSRALEAQGRHEEAYAATQTALTEKLLHTGPVHDDVEYTYRELARHARRLGKEDEASAQERLADETREKLATAK